MLDKDIHRKYNRKYRVDIIINDEPLFDFYVIPPLFVFVQLVISSLQAKLQQATGSTIRDQLTPAPHSSPVLGIQGGMSRKRKACCAVRAVRQAHGAVVVSVAVPYNTSFSFGWSCVSDDQRWKRIAALQHCRRRRTFQQLAYPSRGVVSSPGCESRDLADCANSSVL